VRGATLHRCRGRVVVWGKRLAVGGRNGRCSEGWLSWVWRLGMCM
jgi:hypothetical protein